MVPVAPGDAYLSEKTMPNQPIAAVPVLVRVTGSASVPLIFSVP